jgi:hypothetical protein
MVMVYNFHFSKLPTTAKLLLTPIGVSRSEWVNTSHVSHRFGAKRRGSRGISEISHNYLALRIVIDGTG